MEYKGLAVFQKMAQCFDYWVENMINVMLTTFLKETIP